MITPIRFSNGTSAFQHPALSETRHGFFTKQGGISSGVYESLNAGYGSKDDRSNIEENRARAAQGLNIQADALCGLYQYHSAEVITYLDDEIPHFRPKADGMVTAREDIALSILTADCAPILLYDSQSRIIGACHAGWRGAVSGIIQNTVEAMCTLGAVAEQITMVIGPTIQKASYQVGDDMRAQALDLARFTAAKNCFTADTEAAGKWHFDLPAFCTLAGKESGLISMHIIDVDTYLAASGDDSTCFSHRYATHHNLTETGRLISIISL